MLICTTYADASGKPSGPVVTMGAVVARMRQWKKFEQQWRRELAAYGVKQFHATDFASSKAEFKNWKGDTQKRGRFFHEIVRIMHRHLIIAPISVSVETAAWNSVNAEYQLEEVFRSPYALAGHSVVQLIMRWARSIDTDPRVKFIFEDGEDEDHGGLQALCKKEGITPEFQSKAAAVPCQAADLVAWKNRIACVQSLKLEKAIQDAPDGQLLFEMINEYNSAMTVMTVGVEPKVYGRETLLKNCEKFHIPLRDTVK